MKLLLAASIRKVKAGLRHAASEGFQDYPPGTLELGTALDAVDMVANDIRSACQGRPGFWNDAGPTATARKLRLAVVQNVYRQGLVSEAQARELLSSPLTPEGDNVFDDAQWLATDETPPQA